MIRQGPTDRYPVSIPNITFVVLDAVTLEHQSKLLLKGPFPVVLFLTGDVRFDLFDVRLADGKRAVTVLPMEFPQRQPFFFDARRGSGFHLFDQLGDGDRPMQVAKDVNVVLRATDDQRRTMDVPQDTDHVASHNAADFGRA
jgi:hypothetical protein